MVLNFEGQRILVVGAARGIGASLAELLRVSGAEVVAMDCLEVEGSPVIRVDLTQPASIESAAGAVPSSITGVAYVAGVPATATPSNILQVNFLAMRSLVSALHSKVSDQSTAVFVSSITAHRCEWSDDDLENLVTSSNEAVLDILRSKPMDGVESYELSKRALNYWVASRLPAFMNKGIRANIVSPGPVETDILRDFEKSMGRSRIEAASELAGRHGSPDEIAEVIAFLLSERSRWIAGVDVRVDGGFSTLREAHGKGVGLAFQRSGEFLCN